MILLEYFCQDLYSLDYIQNISSLLEQHNSMGCFKETELEKPGSAGSVEPNFFLFLRQICPVFRQIVTKNINVYLILPNLTKFTKCYQILQSFNQILPNFYKVLLRFQILVIYVCFQPNL